MLKLRIVYNEEFTTLCRLFFLTENRNLEHDDYLLENGYLLFLSRISEKLDNLLRRFEIETIWSPLWVDGIARGLFSNDVNDIANLMELVNVPEIPWIDKFGPVVFIDRNYYSIAVDIINKIPVNLIYAGDVNPKRLITGKVSSSGQLPDEITFRMIDLYLQGWNFFVLPMNDDIPNLKQKILENYKRTRSRRVPGNRSPVSFADLGYAVPLDSADELLSLLNLISIPNSRGHNEDPSFYKYKLYFPPNPKLQGDNAKIWRYPVKVGKEDLYLELSYYRDTGLIDPEYYQYRMFQIEHLDPVKREFFISKHRL